MPVLYAVGLAGTNTDLGTIPAPPANKLVTKIDWVNAVIAGCSANFTYIVNVSATGGMGVANNSRLDLAILAAPASGASYWASFGDGLLACGIGSSVLARSAGTGTSGGVASVQIGYHYE